jgi:prolyl oligopeptidase
MPNEDFQFNNFLNEYWDKQLDSHPLYSSSLGYSKYDRKISSNSIRAHNELVEVSKNNLKKLLEFDIALLSDDNKLNFKLLKTHLENDIRVNSNPTYFLDLNQRGGIQNIYDSASRLTFNSFEDYENWLFRLNLFAENISNSLNNNRLGLEKGITQPKHIIKKVVEQLKNLLDLGVDNSPFLNIFNESSVLTDDEKEFLLGEVKILIADTINPLYQELYDFLNEE